MSAQWKKTHKSYFYLTFLLLIIEISMTVDKHIRSVRDYSLNSQPLNIKSFFIFLCFPIFQP